MPDIDVTFLVDDDDLTVASLQTRSDAVEDGVNGIMSYGARAGAVSHNHVETLVIETGINDSAAAPVATLFIAGSGTHAYTTTYTPTTDFDDDDATSRVIVGSDEVGGGTYNSTDKQLVFDLATAGPNGDGLLLGMSRADRVAGILILLNVEFETFTLDTLTDLHVMTCIQVLTNAGVTWHTIGRTERFMERRVSVAFADTSVNQDIATRCLLLPADLTAEGLDPATDKVTGIRAMTAMVLVAGTPGTDQIQLGACQMSIIPLHAEEV